MFVPMRSVLVLALARVTCPGAAADPHAVPRGLFVDLDDEIAAGAIVGDGKQVSSDDLSRP